MFDQLSGRESLRGLVVLMDAHRSKYYYPEMGKIRFGKGKSGQGLSYL